MKGFQTRLGGGRAGRHMHPEICFCYSRGVGKPLLSFGEQMLIPLPCLPLIHCSPGRCTYGFESLGSPRTSSDGSCSSSALAHLPAVDSTPCETALGRPHHPSLLLLLAPGMPAGFMLWKQSCPTRSSPTAWGHPTPPCAQAL